jgi:hypothetical protein
MVFVDAQRISLMDTRRLKKTMVAIVAKQLVAASQLLVQEVRVPEPWRHGLRVRRGMEIHRLGRRARRHALMYPRGKRRAHWITFLVRLACVMETRRRDALFVGRSTKRGRR